MTASRTRQCWPCPLDDVDDVERYSHGGFHPMHLGDIFADGGYKVIHKRGFGGSSTVWLARDSLKRRYVSFNILQAEVPKQSYEVEIHKLLKDRSGSHAGSAHISLLLRHFNFSGRNGSHTVLVLELAGSSLLQYYQCPGQVAGNGRLRGDLAQSTPFQTAQALGFMHKSGVVHGGRLIEIP